jgi:hypothetical protein
MKTSVSIVGVPAEIRTKHLPNIEPKRYCLLGCFERGEGMVVGMYICM